MTNDTLCMPHESLHPLDALAVALLHLWCVDTVALAAWGIVGNEEGETHD